MYENKVGITDAPFIDISEFPELQALSLNVSIIQQELQHNNIWLQWGSDAYDPLGHCVFLSGDWTVCPVYFGLYNPFMMVLPGIEQTTADQLLKEIPDRFPKTIELLKKIPNLNFSAFSRLHPNSQLAPHKHRNPNSFIYHLGIVIPPGNTCGLCVGGKNHIWTKPGDAVIFNDNLEHSAWNDSDQERIILYIDFVRPEKYKRVS